MGKRRRRRGRNTGDGFPLPLRTVHQASVRGGKCVTDRPTARLPPPQLKRASTCAYGRTNGVLLAATTTSAYGASGGKTGRTSAAAKTVPWSPPLWPQGSYCITQLTSVAFANRDCLQERSKKNSVSFCNCKKIRRVSGGSKQSSRLFNSRSPTPIGRPRIEITMRWQLTVRKGGRGASSKCIRFESNVFFKK